MIKYQKKELNEYQVQQFKHSEANNVKRVLKEYKDVLAELSTLKKPVKILDIGGGSGALAFALHEYLGDCEHEIYVLEITKYEIWNEFSNCIHFVEGSAFDVEKFFKQNTFDIIFVNYVFHHLIQKSHKCTIDGFKSMLASIRSRLKDDGKLCISECYYYMPIIKEASGLLIYTASTFNLPFLVKILHKFGAKSSGVGVCFLSKEKWNSLISQSGYYVLTAYEKPAKTMRLVLREHFFNFVLCKNTISY